jgi:hypothetical protein
MNKYIFPFNSCEIPQNNGVAQPYSSFINIILCLIIIFFLINSNNIYSKLFLISLLIFNIFHTLSHSIHINNNSQFMFTHASAIISTFFLFFMLEYITKKKINFKELFLLLLLYVFDIYLINKNASHIYNIIIFMLILFSIFIFYYDFISNNLKKNIKYIIFFSILTLFFQIFEILYCKKILEQFNNFPLHIITETFGLISITFLCYSFYKI